MNENNIYSPPEASLDNPQDHDSAHPERVLASRWARLWGSLIDAIVAGLITFPLLYLLGYWDQVMSGSLSITGTVLVTLMGFLLFVLLHGYLLAKRGQTIGKWIVGTRIVSIESNRILPLSKVLLVRYLPVSIIASIPMLGQLLIFIDNLFVFRADKRCLHDLWSGTQVVKAR